MQVVKLLREFNSDFLRIFSKSAPLLERVWKELIKGTIIFNITFEFFSLRQSVIGYKSILVVFSKADKILFTDLTFEAWIVRARRAKIIKVFIYLD